MASVIGNPTPDAEVPKEYTVTGRLPLASPSRMEEVFFLDPDTFLGPVRRAFSEHLSALGAGSGLPGREPAFPRRRRNRRAVPLLP